MEAYMGSKKEEKQMSNDAIWDYQRFCPKCEEKGKKIKLNEDGENRKCPICLTIYFVVKGENERELE
jgi:NADH pyrophosphatase NudC (nudix superfamily)